jgi:D-galacturonate reductase
MVDWQSIKSPKHKGTGVYTASWTAPLKAGVHSAQHWYYMGEKVRRGPVFRRARELTGDQGDITVDQAHRGYDVTVDETGKQWYNPF